MWSAASFGVRPACTAPLGHSVEITIDESQPTTGIATQEISWFSGAALKIASSFLKYLMGTWIHTQTHCCSLDIYIYMILLYSLLILIKFNTFLFNAIKDGHTNQTCHDVKVVPAYNQSNLLPDQEISVRFIMVKKANPGCLSMKEMIVVAFETGLLQAFSSDWWKDHINHIKETIFPCEKV